MNTSSFLTALRTNASLPLVFRAGGDIVSPGYHLTEVKRVAYETMDCGGMTHRWSESQFEIWVPAAAEATPGRGHMAADKFLRIVDRVERALPLDAGATARIHASFGRQPAALYDIDSITAVDGELVIDLVPDRTRCKSAERRLASAAATAQLAANAGCCGESSPAAADANEEPASCGCGPTRKEEAAVACCA